MYLSDYDYFYVLKIKLLHGDSTEDSRRFTEIRREKCILIQNFQLLIIKY